MKSIMTKWLPLLLLVLVLAGFGYVAVTDIPVTQNAVEKPVSNDRFFR